MAIAPRLVGDGLSHLALIRVTDRVWTPGGREASVIAVNRDIGEATVQWDDGDRGHFKISQLRRMPRAKGT